MKLKYLFVLIVIGIQVSISMHTYKECRRIKLLNELINSPEPTFTTHGLKQMNDAFECLSPAVTNSYLERKGKPASDIEYRDIIKNLIKEHPLHLLGTKEEDNRIEIKTLFNTREPVNITFVMVKEGDKYKIEGMDNICELYKKINVYFENKQAAK